MRKLNLTTIFLFITYICSAQTPADLQLGDVTFGKGRISNFSEFHLSYENERLISDQWQTGNVQFESGGKLKDVPMIFDLESQELYMKYEKATRAIKLQSIDQFDWIDHQTGLKRKFVDGQKFKTNLAGVVELLFEKDSIILIRKFDLDIQPGNYNPALNVGNKTRKVSQRSEYYLLLMNESVSLHSNKRNIAASLTDYLNDPAKEYLKNFKGRFKEPSDYCELVKQLVK